MFVKSVKMSSNLRSFSKSVVLTFTGAHQFCPLVSCLFRKSSVVHQISTQLASPKWRNRFLVSCDSQMAAGGSFRAIKGRRLFAVRSGAPNFSPNCPLKMHFFCISDEFLLCWGLLQMSGGSLEVLPGRRSSAGPGSAEPGSASRSSNPSSSELHS